MPLPSEQPVTPHLGVIVVNYGSSELLAQHLAAIDRADLVPSVVVVVDNHSSDRERRAVDDLCGRHGWELLALPTNVGFGAAMNAGVERAAALGSTVFLLLNPDVSIDAAAVGALVAASGEHPATLLTPRLERPDGSVWFAGGQLDLQLGVTRSRPDHAQQGADRWLTGACLVVDRRAWEMTGGFDPDYFLYWEDVDLSRRLLEAGGELLVLHDVRAVHRVGGTQRGDGGKSALYGYYMCRNRLRFAIRHLPVRDRLRWLASSPRYAVRVSTRSGRRDALRRPSVPLAALAGTLAGAWNLLVSIARPARAAT